jgi:hypothetical protein
VRDTYWKRKACDFVLASVGFGLAVFIGNRPDQLRFGSFSADARTVVAPDILKDSAKSYQSISRFESSLKGPDGKLVRWKERKKLLRAEVKAIRRSDESTSGKVLLTVLAVLAAVGLLYVVAALACSLSCDGADAAALLVGIAGTALVIVLLVVLIHAIYRRQRKERKEKAMREPLGLQREST